MKPPALARFLAAVVGGRDDRDFVLGDLDDGFQRVLAERGVRGARRWYWSQVLRGIGWAVRPDAEVIRRRSWEGTAGDLRMGVRTLRKRPIYAVGVIGTLALGLGSAALVFTVTWRVWLAPMPFPDPDRVVRVFETEPVDMTSAVEGGAEQRTRWRISPPLLEDMRANDWTTLEAVAGVSDHIVDWEQDDEARRVTTLAVSPELFAILGIVPEAGRLLSSDPEVPEVVLTTDFWARAFGRDPGVLGSTTMELDGAPHTVVGVVRLPSGYPSDADLVTRLSFVEEQLGEGMRGARYLDVVARVRPEHSVAEASSEAASFVRALGESYGNHAGWGAELVVLGDDLTEPFRGVLSLLLAAGVTFLLLAVINVGGLVAARRAEARHDRAVRLALGASRGRLLRTSAVEGLLVGGLAAAAGLVGAYWLLGPIRALVPPDVPRLSEVGLTPPLMALVLGIGLGLGVGVGVVGHWLSRGGAAFRPDDREPVSALGGRRALVVGQVALTTLLTTGGIAVLRYASELRSIDVGFEAEGLRSSWMTLSQQRFPGEEEWLGVWQGMLDGMQARGIDAAVATNPPMSGSNWLFGFQADDAPDQGFAQHHSVSEGYFDAMGIDVLEGRVFDPDDRASSAPVVVVNEAFAEEYFPRGDAIGREVRVVGDLRTVVGIVGSTRHYGPSAEVQLEMYVPLGQNPWPNGAILMRTERSDADAVLTDVARAIDPSLEATSTIPYTAYLDEWFAPLRLQLVLVGTLAFLGLTLASLGLYALVAYHVSTRRREIGIRMALGAPVDRVLRGVVGQGLLLAGMGGLGGLIAWYALLPTTRDLVEGVNPTDPLVPVLVAMVVGVACLLATVVPAWRATSVDPVVTLKAE
ncbi:MAG: ABC transporter permease [Gemmatimonadota bacterium]